MATYRINVGKKLLVNATFGSKGGILSEAVTRTMRNKKGQVADLAHNIIKSNPATGKVLKETLSPLTDSVNNTINRTFHLLGNFLSSQQGLPPGPSGGAKNIVMGGGISYRTQAWDSFATSYEKSIKTMARATPPRHSGEFNFLMERPFRFPKEKNPPGEPLSTMAMQLMHGGVSNPAFKTPSKAVFSANGRKIGATFDAKTIKLRRARGHSRRAGKGKVIQVAGFDGEMFLPTSIAQGRMSVSVASFSSMIFSALALGNPAGDTVGTGLPSGKALGISSETGPTLFQLLMINEFRRPFIAKAFARTTDIVVKNLRRVALFR